MGDDCSSGQKINKLLHAFGYSIPIGKDGRRLWPSKFKKDMVQKLRSKELTAVEISKACKTSQYTVRQWEREFGRKHPKRKPVLPEVAPDFVEVKFNDTQAITPDIIAFHCNAFELKLPSDYPLSGIVRIIQTLERGT